MKIWHRFPFVRLLFPFVSGIILAIVTGMPIRPPLFLLPLMIGAFIAFEFIFQKRISFKFRWLLGLYINILFFLLGYQLTYHNTPKFDHRNISHFSGKSTEYVFRVSEAVVEKPGSIKVVANVVREKVKEGWEKVNGSVMLYFQKDDLSGKIKYGDEFLAEINLQDVNPPQNPGEFNYKRYLAYKGIYQQAYVKSGSWKLTGENRGNPLFTLGIKVREHFLEILETNGIKGKEFAVASAVLLGYGDKLDSDQRREFSGAGAMHILCVSGLHVGIIYFVLNSLLAFMDKKRLLRILKVVLLLLSLWLYALITGFSPSVLRASTMFSAIVLGRSLKRNTHIYNLLAASAFLLLVWNPYILTEVGFQLSYLAVAGIVTFFKPIYNLMIPKNWLLDQIWQITVVSFTATLSTFPLSLFYFHRFPNLFLMTNLVAIPASMIIIYVGLAVLLTSPIPFVSGLLAKVLAWVIWILNTSVHWIEGLRFSTTDGVFLSFPELLFLFGITVSLAFLLFQYRKYPVYFALGFALLFLVSINFRKAKQITQSKFIVYNVNKRTAIDFINGKQDILLADSLLLQDEGKQSYHIQNNRFQSGIRNIENFALEAGNIQSRFLQKTKGFIRFKDKTILLLDPESRFFPSSKKANIDYLVFSKNPKIDFDKLLESFDFDTLIFDSSNSNWRTEEWETKCRERDIAFHNVKKDGAFVANLN